MTPADIRPGATYLIGAGCGAPYEWAPLIMRVTRIEDPDQWNAHCWLHGYQLDSVTGDAVALRTVYVGQTAGMQPAAPTPPPGRRPLNTGPRLPRQRTTTTFTTARTR